MTARLREAAAKMADIWDRATTEHSSRDISKAMGHDNYRAMFDAWSTLRAALAQPPDEDDEFRRGVEAAAKAADDEAREYESHSIELDRKGAYAQGTNDLRGALACHAVAARIRALLPQPAPAPSAKEEP